MATTSFYTLFESASGYGLFSILETEEIGAFLEEVSNYMLLHIMTAIISFWRDSSNLHILLSKLHYPRPLIRNYPTFLYHRSGPVRYHWLSKISACCEDDRLPPLRDRWERSWEHQRHHGTRDDWRFENFPRSEPRKGEEGQQVSSRRGKSITSHHRLIVISQLIWRSICGSPAQWFLSMFLVLIFSRI